MKIWSSKERAAASKVLVSGFLLAVLVACLLAAKPAHASTVFTVDSTGDETDANVNDSSCDINPNLFESTCTLRAAIQESNDTPGADTIHFDIPGSYVHTISPEYALPSINDTVTIDGYTQPGAEENTLKQGNDAVLTIQLNGYYADSGLPGLAIYGENSVVRGLVINRFDRTGLQINSGGAGSKVEGNFIGTSPSGTIDLGNGDYGVYVSGANATIGGVVPEDRNVISGNDLDGVIVGSSPGIKVMGNFIGTSKDGTAPLSNFGNGVGLFGMSSTVGSATPGAANIIAFNGADGVGGYYDTPKGNRILSNSIFSNVEEGIDLGSDGPTPNDPGDADSGYNELQNFPVLTSARTSRKGTTVKGTLDSVPNMTFNVQFFSNLKGNDEGKKFIGQKSVSADSSGDASFTFKPEKKVGKGQNITATATSSVGNTSEFSTPRVVKSL